FCTRLIVSECCRVDDAVSSRSSTTATTAECTQRYVHWMSPPRSSLSESSRAAGLSSSSRREGCGGGCSGGGNSNLLERASINREREAPAIVYADHSVLSYGDLDESIGRTARVLAEKYKLEKGDRVLARTGKSIDSLRLYLATLRLGAVYVPLNPTYTKEETAHFVQDSSPRVFVTSSHSEDSMAFRERIESIVDEKEMARDGDEVENGMNEIEHVTAGDPACICYTSGTTGLPKGAILTHGGLVSNATALVNAWQFKQTDRLLHSLPFYHVHGMFISLNCALFSHSTVLWRDRFSVEDTLEWMRDATVMMGVPTYYSRLLNSPSFNRGCIPKRLRLFVSGSAPLSPAVFQKFREVTGHTILERYGMTEAQVITSNPYEGDRQCGTVGVPLPGTEIRVNKSGILETRSNSVFGGYWRNPKKTAEEFTVDGYFITGDVGKIDENGYVTILGRGNDLIISGGLNVYPKQVEDVIDHIEGVTESAVIAVPHSDLGEAVVAVVAMKENIEESSHEKEERRILETARSKLAGYKTPKRVIFVDCLPRNSMAKIQKNVLRDQYKGLFEV
ncbi:hypothetical protein PMAYCL1PPCAC_02327, partial [Pristionchus mayeri]